MKRYKVTSISTQIVDANSKQEALDEFYNTTDGSEYIETIKLIRKKRKGVLRIK